MHMPYSRDTERESTDVELEMSGRLFYSFVPAIGGGLAGVLPARRASRLDVPTAIHGE